MKINIKLTLLIASLILYLLSLYFPAFGCNYFGADSARYTIVNGSMILILGWLGLLIPNFGWLANITYLITLFLILKNSQKVLVFTVVNLILGLSSLLLYFDHTQEVGVYVGFYLWISSFLLLIIYGMLSSGFFPFNKSSEPRRSIKSILIIFILLVFVVVIYAATFR